MIQIKLSAISCLDYPPNHLDMVIIPEGWTNWSGCQNAINLSFWAWNHSHNPFNQRIILESHTTPHTPQSHAIGENNRRIVRNKASIYIVPNRTISIFVLVNVVAMYTVQSTYELQPSSKRRGVQPSWQALLLCTTILHIIVYTIHRPIQFTERLSKLAVYVHVLYSCPHQRFPALPISGAAELRRCRLKDSDPNRALLVGTLIVAVRLLSPNANLLGTITPCKPLKYSLHKKRFPFLPSHIIFTNKPIPAQLSILHQIMYRLTGDPHIHLNHAAGISPHVVWSALHNLVIRWCRNVQY